MDLKVWVEIGWICSFFFFNLHDCFTCVLERSRRDASIFLFERSFLHSFKPCYLESMNQCPFWFVVLGRGYKYSDGFSKPVSMTVELWIALSVGCDFDHVAAQTLDCEKK